MARKQIKRHTRQYQLRDENPIDKHVDSILDFWKGNREEVTKFRQAIDLFYALEQGNLNALYDYFPQYKNAVGNGGGDDEIKSMLELIIARQKQSNSYTLQPMQPAPTAITGKPLGGFKPLAAPIDDDDLPTLAVKKNTSTNASANFLESLAGI